MLSGEIQRGNFVLKTLILEHTHLISLIQNVETSDKQQINFGVFLYGRGPYIGSMLAKGLFCGQYEQEKW